MNIIGRRIEIINSSNPNLIGLNGLVVDETRNIIMLKTAKDSVKAVPKDVCIFRVYLNDKFIDVDGKTLIGRLERRLVK
jgi:ribonuclease P protein subunit POP4